MKSALAISIVVVVLIAYGLLWGASRVAGSSALGRLPKLPKNSRRWLFGEHNSTAH